MLQTRIYQERFNDPEKRNDLWKILVKDFFQQFISKKDTVLEVACGYGEFINNINCGKKIAIDINPQSKKYLDKKVYFIKTSAIKIPLKDESVNIVFISNFFEHITRSEILSIIKELKRILKPKGKLLVLQPNIRFCAKDYWMFFDHITPIDDRALIEIFSAHGFRCRKNIKRFLPYTTKSNLPQADIFVKLYLKIPFLWYILGKQSFLVFQK